MAPRLYPDGPAESAAPSMPASRTGRLVRQNATCVASLVSDGPLQTAGAAPEADPKRTKSPAADLPSCGVGDGQMSSWNGRGRRSGPVDPRGADGFSMSAREVAPGFRPQAVGISSLFRTPTAEAAVRYPVGAEVCTMRAESSGTGGRLRGETSAQALDADLQNWTEGPPPSVR